MTVATTTPTARADIRAPKKLITSNSQLTPKRDHYRGNPADVGGPVQLLLLDGGHAPHLEHPTEVESAVIGFLSGLDQRLR